MHDYNISSTGGGPYVISKAQNIIENLTLKIGNMLPGNKTEIWSTSSLAKLEMVYHIKGSCGPYHMDHL